jgi:hypothetical protein
MYPSLTLTTDSAQPASHRSSIGYEQQVSRALHNEPAHVFELRRRARQQLFAREA